MIPVTLIDHDSRNEEANIEKCLQSAHGLVDQIFVIDSESEDETAAIARRYATVINLPYEHGKIIPWIYQWGLDNLPIRNEWVLILEADQALTPELSNELVELFSRSQISERGFYVRRTQVFRGKRLRFGGYGSKYMLKLFYRTAGELDTEDRHADLREWSTRQIKGTCIKDEGRRDPVFCSEAPSLRRSLRARGSTTPARCGPMENYSGLFR